MDSFYFACKFKTERFILAIPARSNILFPRAGKTANNPRFHTALQDVLRPPLLGLALSAALRPLTAGHGGSYRRSGLGRGLRQIVQPLAGQLRETLFVQRKFVKYEEMSVSSHGGFIP